MSSTLTGVSRSSREILYGGYKTRRMARPPSQKPLRRLDVPLSDAVAARLFELQKSVRGKGITWPAPRTLISALIMAEARRGAELEQDLLIPFRLDHPDAD